MIILFITGVVYPISFLPARNGADYHFADLTWDPFSSGVHWWVLAFVTFIVAFGLYYLYGLVKSIHFDKALLKDFNEKSDFDKQPVWYRNYIVNTKNGQDTDAD